MRDETDGVAAAREPEDRGPSVVALLAEQFDEAEGPVVPRRACVQVGHRERDVVEARELAHRRALTGAEQRPTVRFAPMHDDQQMLVSGINHVAILTSDTPRLCAFYGTSSVRWSRGSCARTRGSD